jgi:hypothetical protein
MKIRRCHRRCYKFGTSLSAAFFQPSVFQNLLEFARSQYDEAMIRYCLVNVLAHTMDLHMCTEYKKNNT